MARMVLANQTPGCKREPFQAHPRHLPLMPDEAEPQYTTSFLVDDEEGIRGFFQQNGFVVVRGVLDSEGCAETRATILEIIRDHTSGAFDPNDPTTWGAWPENSIEQYGSPQRAPVFRKRFLQNRQLPGIHKAHAILFGTNELLVNHDRCCCFRPTGVDPNWATKINVHLDMNPWQYSRPPNESVARQMREELDYSRPAHFIQENNMPNASEGLSVQCVLNLHENLTEDGGFVTVPGFHHRFDEVFRPEDPNQQEDRCSYGFPKNTDVSLAAGRVAMREGSLVIWDQRMAHGSFPNRSERPRFAQFLKLYPASIVEPGRLSMRAAALQAAMREVIKGPGNPDGLEVTEVGRLVFGTDQWKLPEKSDPCYSAFARAMGVEDESEGEAKAPERKKRQRQRLQ